MQEAAVRNLLTELRRILGADATDESVKEAMYKVILHRPLRASDDVVAKNTDLPLKAVTIIREMIRAMGEEKSFRKTRACINGRGMQLPVPNDPDCKYIVKKTYIPNYRKYHTKNKTEGQNNET